MAKAFPGLGATVCDTISDLPTSPTEGMIAYQKDTNELKIHDGSNWITMLDTDTPPACSLLYNQSFGTTTLVTINNVFNSGFRSYKLVYSIVSNQATINNVIMKLRVSGSDISSGYYNRLWYSDGGTTQVANQNNYTSCDWAMYHGNIISAGTIEFFNPSVGAAKTWVWQGGAFGGSTNLSYQGVAYNGSTSAVDGLSLTSSGGSFTSGVIKIYGFRESI